MADEYTPTTAQMRQLHIGAMTSRRAGRDAEFDRWLAAHDQEVREAAARDVQRRIDAFIRHGEAVPADVTTYDREAVHNDLRVLAADIAREAPHA